jgi:Family of unknown function (DUF6789)
VNFNIKQLFKGIIAGLAATHVLTLLLIMKKMTGVMPELDPTHILATLVSEVTNMPKNLNFAWVLFTMTGTFFWGGIFAIVNKHLPTEKQILKGMIFSIAPWTMMMGAMPFSGAGFFGTHMSLITPVMTLPMNGAGFSGTETSYIVPIMTFILHMIFGAILGIVFSLLNEADAK